MVSERSAVAASAGGAVSVQIGAALGATLFPLIGPIGVVALRQAVAAVVLVAVARPRLHRMGWSRLWPGLLLGATLVVMNLALYSSVQRVGLGLAVTLEFLGPLAVALVSSRRLVDIVFALVAGAGVVLLTGTVTGLDPVGIGLGLLAAGAWAAYILLTQRVGARLPGVQGTAVASLVASIATAPLLVLALLALDRDELFHVLAVGLVIGVLSSALPYSIDLIVLRRMRRHLFGVLQSVHPAGAAVVGFLILGQTLGLLQVAGVALICVSNIAAALLAGRRVAPTLGRRGQPARTVAQ